MSDAIRKLILTVEVREERGEEVEALMLDVAELLNGRLTRSFYEPTDMTNAAGDLFYTQRGSKTLRKLGKLG